MSATRIALLVGGGILLSVAGAAALVAIGMIELPPQADPLTNLLRRDESLGASTACEEVLKAQLRSPATYRRIAVDAHILPPLTLDEYRAYELSFGCPSDPYEDGCKELRRIYIAGSVKNDRKLLGLGARKPSGLKQQREEVIQAFYQRIMKRSAAENRTALVSIEYDAVNAYNAPIRGTHVCRFGPIGRADRFTTEDIFDPGVDTEGW